MDCRECIENMTSFLDQELNPAESAQMQSHLEVCSSCAAELRDFQQTAVLVESNAQDLDVRPESWNAICDRIRDVPSASPFGFLLPKWNRMLVTVAIVAAFSIGYVWYQHDQKRSLDDYISQYVKSREAGFQMQTMNSVMPNPFAEARPAPDTNPFRLEDR